MTKRFGKANRFPLSQQQNDDSDRLPATGMGEDSGVTDQACILVVDDDPDIRELLEDYLSGQGYRVAAVASAQAMRAALAEQLPDVVLLDVGLPGEDGLSLARHLREHFDVGIIMVSSAGETLDRIVGLEVGADDCVAKPFDPRELHARVKSVLRRYQQRARTAQSGARSPEATPRQVPFGVGVLDLDSCRLFGANGEEIAITAMEFELLKVFAERPNRPLSRDQLLNLTQNRDWDPYRPQHRHPYCPVAAQDRAGPAKTDRPENRSRHGSHVRTPGVSGGTAFPRRFNCFRFVTPPPGGALRLYTYPQVKRAISAPEQ